MANISVRQKHQNNIVSRRNYGSQEVTATNHLFTNKLALLELFLKNIGT